MVGIGRLGEGAAEVHFRLFDIARVQALHADVEVIFGAEVAGGIRAGGAPLADLDVGAGFVGDMSSRTLRGIKEAIAGLGQLAQGE